MDAHNAARIPLHVYPVPFAGHEVLPRAHLGEDVVLVMVDTRAAGDANKYERVALVVPGRNLAQCHGRDASASPFTD
jgi:hypothetical protein